MVHSENDCIYKVMIIIQFNKLITEINRCSLIADNERMIGYI